eukprot:3756946-Prorocentrum_lima.AAC.1
MLCDIQWQKLTNWITRKCDNVAPATTPEKFEETAREMCKSGPRGRILRVGNFLYQWIVHHALWRLVVNRETRSWSLSPGLA